MSDNVSKPELKSVNCSNALSDHLGFGRTEYRRRSYTPVSQFKSSTCLFGIISSRYPVEANTLHISWTDSELQLGLSSSISYCSSGLSLTAEQ